MNIELTTYQQGFLDYLKKEHFDQAPGELYDPINYILGLGGKRMRPILVLAAAGAFDRLWQNALYRARGADRHESRRTNLPMGGGEPTKPGRAVASEDLESATHAPPSARCRNVASP